MIYSVANITANNFSCQLLCLSVSVCGSLPWLRSRFDAAYKRCLGPCISTSHTVSHEVVYARKSDAHGCD